MEKWGHEQPGRNHQKNYPRTCSSLDIKESLLSAFKYLRERVPLEVLKLAEGKIHGLGGAAELFGMNPNTLR